VRPPIAFSTIGRPIDLGHPTNRAIALLALATFGAGTLTGALRGEAWGALITGLTWAGSTFLAWALARETDPDRPCSAFIAAAGGLVGAIGLGRPGFLFLFWFLIALRYINRSTGVAPGIADFVALYGIKLWLGFSAHWTIPLLTFPTVFFGDIQRFPRALRVGLPLALPAAAVAIGFARGWHLELPEWGWVEIAAVAAIAVSIVPVIVSYRRVHSVGDRTGEPLRPHRVQWAIGWAATAALILTLTGAATVAELAPLWSALAATALGWGVACVAKRPTGVAR
jgi:hypothetical protein